MYFIAYRLFIKVEFYQFIFELFERSVKPVLGASPVLHNSFKVILVMIRLFKPVYAIFFSFVYSFVFLASKDLTIKS